jgi:acetoin:2,6-dichlorophenolindophenol oxidoreductase subunit beta
MREIEYREAIREAINEEMQSDDSVFVLGEDVGSSRGAFRVTTGLLEKYGSERILGTPISETTIIGAAVGAAITGQKPIAEIMFMDFIPQAMDQIVNQAAKINFMTGDSLEVPLVIRTPGGIAKSTGAQHSQSLEAWFYHVPGLKIAIPSTPYDAKGLLKTAIRDNNPVIFIEHKMLYLDKGPVPKKDYTIPFGQADIKRKGSSVTIFAYSRMVQTSIKASKELEKEGINCEIIDPRTLVPLDIDTLINSVKKTNHLVIVVEACERGGVGSHICSLVINKAFDWLDSPIEIVAGLNTPIPYNDALENACYPHKQDVIRAVKKIL